jgi:hypothetical protein
MMVLLEFLLMRICGSLVGFIEMLKLNNNHEISISIDPIALPLFHFWLFEHHSHQPGYSCGLAD